MILGVGTDLVEIERIKKSLEKFPDRFAKKILAEDELSEFRRSKVSAAFLAKRFAAKEAVAKALGTGMRQGVHFTSIEVCHDQFGKPGVLLHGDAERRAQELGVKRWHLSISDERQHALAFVIAESE